MKQIGKIYGTYGTLKVTTFVKQNISLKWFGMNKRMSDFRLGLVDGRVVRQHKRLV